MRKFAVTLAALALLAVPAAAQASPKPTQVCLDRYTCTFQSTNFGGTMDPFFNPDNASVWINLPTRARASVQSRGSSDVWFWNRAAGLYVCVVANGQDSDLTFPGGFGFPGYMFIDYGVNDGCFEPHPSGAPGS